MKLSHYSVRSLTYVAIVSDSLSPIRENLNVSESIQRDSVEYGPAAPELVLGPHSWSFKSFEDFLDRRLSALILRFENKEPNEFGSRPLK